MSVIARVAESWALMRPKARLALLTRLQEAMGFEESIWDGIPAEVFADTPDFNSLPSDLCGHLILSFTGSGLTADRFSRFCRETLGAAPIF